MKKILLSIIVVALSFTAFAQTESQHLSFKNVPINGTLNEFVTNMKAQGFIAKVDRGGKATLYGDFAGYKDCEIYVYTLQNKDLVSTISVLFPECSNWNMLEGNYLKLKSMLTQKYGEPAMVVEEFQNQHIQDDDNSKWREFKMDRCIFSTTFTTDKGQLILKMTMDDYRDCHVLLSYYDRINGMEVEAAAMDDL